MGSVLAPWHLSTDGNLMHFALSAAYAEGDGDGGGDGGGEGGGGDGGDGGGGDGGDGGGGGDGDGGGTPGCTTAADCPQPTTTCQTATCVGGTCGFANAGQGGACDDGDKCTIASVCLNGVCQAGVPIVCTPADVCHVAGVCDPATGVCSNPAAPNGTPCGLGTCQGGVCVDPCTPNPCNTPPPPGPCIANTQMAYLAPGICTPAGPGFTCIYTPTILPC
jgi:hypothetical protein